MFCLDYLVAEVMKVLRAKKYAKMKKNLPESMEMLETDPENRNSSCEAEARSELNRPTQVNFQIHLGTSVNIE